MSSLLSNTQQKKVSGVENVLFAGKVPPTDYIALDLLKGGQEVRALSGHVFCFTKLHLFKKQ